MAVTTSRSVAFYKEVVCIGSLYNDNEWTNIFWADLVLSNTGNEVDMVLEPCVDGKKLSCDDQDGGWRIL